MENLVSVPVSGKTQCSEYPGHSKCLKKITKGNCPKKETHGCNSSQYKHGTDVDFQKVQTSHFMTSLAEDKHLEPHPGERALSEGKKELIKGGPQFRPYP